MSGVYISTRRCHDAVSDGDRRRSNRLKDVSAMNRFSKLAMNGFVFILVLALGRCKRKPAFLLVAALCAERGNEIEPCSPSLKQQSRGSPAHAHPSTAYPPRSRETST